MPKDAAYWIQHLSLTPHPEGGYYGVTYKSDLSIPHSALPSRFAGDRFACTAIYFLLQGNDFSAFHRIASDEIWHFYDGSSLLVHAISPEGHYSEILLGNKPEAGEVFQGVVKAGWWFASRLRDQSSYALVGCTVAPGFDFAEFELGTGSELIRLYPQHQPLIQSLTRS